MQHYLTPDLCDAYPDLIQVLVLGVVAFAILILKRRDLTLYAFDPTHAHAIGLSPKRLGALLLGSAEIGGRAACLMGCCGRRLRMQRMQIGLDAVTEHIRKCWASLFTSRAIIYRLKNSIPNEGLSMAVVVQKMVNARPTTASIGTVASCSLPASSVAVLCS